MNTALQIDPAVQDLAKRPDQSVDASIVESIRPSRLAPLEVDPAKLASIEAPPPPADGPVAPPVVIASAVELSVSKPANDDGGRVARLEAEVQLLRREILRRNRTIQELSLRLASFDRAE